ncbi:MAG TPA: ABC transporter permease, partial [Vicinamibacterales bacterium]|nr:ABC transporter permease [Vicinamibacterales bacterium]
MRELWRRIAALARGRALDRDIEEELQFHLDMKERDTGNPAAAQRALGRQILIRERARDAWGWRWLDDAAWDIRYALRQFRQNPGFTAAAVLTLAVGIGINATVFTVTNAMLFKGFPHVDPDNRILYIVSTGGNSSYPDFEDWRAEAKSFTDLAVVNSGGLRLRLHDRYRGPETYDGTQLSANAFRVLGRRPVLGRDFAAADEIPGAAPVTILSYSLWERRFSKDPGIIGQTVRIDEAPSTVIGVMPADFDFPHHRVDLWVPFVPTPNLLQRQTRVLWFAFGRLADGATITSARAEMEAIGRRLEAAYPLTNRGIHPRVMNFHEFVLGPNAVTIYGSMWAAVGFVLLIACANLANLLLARAIGRSREIAVRIALGAGRWRITRQLLIESVTLSAVGGVLGWLLTRWCVRANELVAEPPGGYDQWTYAMDYRVFAYVVGMSI